MAHSKIGASSSKRWMTCPGSVRLSEGIPNKSSKYAIEGTAAHTLAEETLTTGGDPRSRIGEYIPVEQDGLTDLVIITEEMADAVALYYDTVNQGTDVGTNLIDVEIKFDLSEYHPGLYGTADCVAYCKDTKQLSVFDFKYGKRLFVSPEENTQLMYYALGAMIKRSRPVDEVELVIVQPRCEAGPPVRRWKTTAMRILDFAADLVEAAKHTERPDAPLVPGDHCQFCPASGICPELTKKSHELARLDFAPLVTYDPQKLSDALTWLPILETWIKNVREFAFDESARGNAIPGWKIVEKVPRRKVTPQVTAEDIAEAFGCDVAEVCEEPKLKGIGELEKLAPGKNKKEREAALAPFVFKESGGLALAPADDRRPSVSVSARDDFATLSIEETRSNG